MHTKKKYENFELDFEFRIDKKNANNGINIRYLGHGSGSSNGMGEIQVLDDNYPKIDPRQAHGSLYGMVAAKRGYQKAQGQWNHQKIKVIGEHISVTLNNIIILDINLKQLKKPFLNNKNYPNRFVKKGFIGLAGHSTPVSYRNMKIRSL